jgi:hypothetical protein
MMSKSVEEFCDVCGGLLYHSIRGSHFKFTQRFFWHGDFDRVDDCDVCGDCLYVISEVVEKNRVLVAGIRKKLKDKSPNDQMKAHKPTTVRKVLNMFNIRTTPKTNEGKK